MVISHIACFSDVEINSNPTFLAIKKYYKKKLFLQFQLWPNQFIDKKEHVLFILNGYGLIKKLFSNFFQSIESSSEGISDNFILLQVFYRIPVNILAYDIGTDSPVVD